IGIAERTPNGRASYEHAATTPRRADPPTMTGLPRSDGSSRCSTAAKNASRSTWTIVRGVAGVVTLLAQERWIGAERDDDRDGGEQRSEQPARQRLDLAARELLDPGAHHAVRRQDAEHHHGELDVQPGAGLERDRRRLEGEGEAGRDRERRARVHQHGDAL